MSENISLFSGYNSSENRTTNYCLLVLKTLYEENPKYLGEVLQDLLGEDLGEIVGVKFRQQEKKKSSVPDGLITQSAFAIYIETKKWDTFSYGQLEAHLKALEEESGLKILIALGNFDSTEPDRFEKIKSLCEAKDAHFAPVSFGKLVSSCKELQDLPKNLTDMLDEFEEYLARQGLLSSWECLLDVVNCAKHAENVIEDNAYMCPATGGAYAHARSKFFGLYRNKMVNRVAFIEAVVELESNEKTSIRWKNAKEGNSEDYIRRAREKHHKRAKKDQYPVRVFLLGPLEETAFYKRTKGGMWSPKKYFQVRALDVKDAKDLAEKLRGKDWPENTWILTP